MHTPRIISVLVAASITLAIFWCGDPVCMNSDDPDCMALFCNLLGHHSGQDEGALKGDPGPCACVSHTPTIPISGFLPAPVTHVDVFRESVAALVPPLFPHSVYHPPRAA